jgi:hypothetical protein
MLIFFDGYIPWFYTFAKTFIITSKISVLMEWISSERPGQYGKKRDEIFREYNNRYGPGNWRVMWQWGPSVVQFEVSCQLYEDAYYSDSFKRDGLWKELIGSAEDVYDHEESDTESGLEYLVQKGSAIHLQDIAVRRVVLRRGWEFSGDRLIQIRSHKEYWGQNLSPGKVPFHLPDMIVVPHLRSWWNPDSVEDFYQSNKVLQIKK